MKGRMKKWSVVLLAAAILTSSQTVSFASSPSFARTDDEWTGLKDNRLEYGEIPDLIHEYNITVQNNQYKYNDFINDYGHTRTDVSNEYISLAIDLESEKSGGDDAASKISDMQLQIQADNLRKQADNNIEDSETYYLTYCQAEDNLSESAEAKFISYYRSKAELETAKEQLEVLQSAFEQTTLKRQAGTATQAEVLSAEESVKTQEEVIKKLELEIENTRQKLIVMLGWKGNDQPEIGDLPQISMDEINSIDQESDKKTAVSNNYTLKINKKKLENAQEEANKNDLQKTIAANEKQIGVSVTDAWQELRKTKLAYEQAEAEALTENRKTDIASQKYAAGVITQHELQSQQHEQSEKQRTTETAKMDLLNAYEIYRWNIKGLAKAE